MSWQILLAISIVTYAASVVLQRVLLKKENSDPIAFSIVFQLITGIIIYFYTIVNGFIMPDFSTNWLNFVLMAILYALANVFIFHSLKLIEASKFTILFSSRVFWTVGAAVFFLKETFSFQQLIGTFLIIVSVIMVSWEKEKIRLNRGELFAIIGAALFGLAFVNDAFILRSNDVASYLVISFITPALLIWITNLKSTKNMKHLVDKTTLPKLLVLSTFYAISGITIFLAYQIGKNAAQIGPLDQIATILIVVFGVFFLKERDYILRKLVGSVVTFVGAFLLK